jgi:hypothetical protein
MKSRSGASQTRSPGSALISLMQLHPLVPPRFPTWSELVATPLGSPASSPPPQGLFDSFVGDPAVLFEDLLRSPEKYEPGVQELLMELLGGRQLSALSKDERALLDRATLDWNRKTSSPPPPASPATSSETEKQKTSSDDSEPSKREVDPEAVPEGTLRDEEMIPFWFR